MKSVSSTIIFFLILNTKEWVTGAVPPHRLLNSTENCDQILNPSIIQQIRAYQPVADQILTLFLDGGYKDRVYQELEKFVLQFPHRPSGSSGLEASIDYAMQIMKELGLENVRGEQVPVPHWIRGEETAELLQPYRKSLHIFGLGTSVGTAAEGITAPLFVVQRFSDLETNADIIPGKILVYNQGWVNNNYGDTVTYRLDGASIAAKYGAVATLVESPAPFSLQTPHTGLNLYHQNVTQIPVACITKEDADFLWRMQKSGQNLTLHLKMLDYNLPLENSRNVFGEIPGKITPYEYVALSGHVDAWDVGQGAMDDGSGVWLSIMALAPLRELDLQPRRTLQAILWTAEEMDFWGVRGFVEQHENLLANYSAALEADFGTFLPTGLDFAGTEEAGCIVWEILKLLEDRLGKMEMVRQERVGADIVYLEDKCVPGASLRNENSKYFWYHHSAADTISMMNSTELDMGAALWTVVGYVLADLPEVLLRDGECKGEK